MLISQKSRLSTNHFLLLSLSVCPTHGEDGSLALRWIVIPLQEGRNRGGLENKREKREAERLAQGRGGIGECACFRCPWCLPCHSINARERKGSGSSDVKAALSLPRLYLFLSPSSPSKLSPSFLSSTHRLCSSLNPTLDLSHSSTFVENYFSFPTYSLSSLFSSASIGLLSDCEFYCTATLAMMDHCLLELESTHKGNKSAADVKSMALGCKNCFLVMSISFVTADFAMFHSNSYT